MKDLKVCGAKEIDRLGRLLAKVADLTAEADAIKDILKSSELTEFEGKLFRATVSTSERVTLDSKMVFAIMQGCNFKLDNTEVRGNSVYLYGNHIADVTPSTVVVDLDTLRRYPSNTMKSRLRALCLSFCGPSIVTKGGAIYVDGVNIKEQRS